MAFPSPQSDLQPHLSALGFTSGNQAFPLFPAALTEPEGPRPAEQGR